MLIFSGAPIISNKRIGGDTVKGLKGVTVVNMICVKDI